MALAVGRGCKFNRMNTGGIRVYYAPVGFAEQFMNCVDEVGKALGYVGETDYNDACIEDPREVRRRIRAL